MTGLDPTAEIQLAVINFFTAVGVNLAAPKSVFFNDRQGTLTVHATDDDLELIEQAINTLNIAPPEVTVKVRFVEVNQNDTRALGFDWYLGNFLMGNNKAALLGWHAAVFRGRSEHRQIRPANSPAMPRRARPNRPRFPTGC